MGHVCWSGTEQVRQSIRNGNWSDAKARIQKGCRTKPEVQARRLAIVVGAMIEGFEADAAVRLVKMFGG